MTCIEKKKIIESWKTFKYFDRSEGAFWFWMPARSVSGGSIFLRLEKSSGKLNFYAKTLISVEEVLNYLSEEERQDILFNLDLFGGR